MPFWRLFAWQFGPVPNSTPLGAALGAATASPGGGAAPVGAPALGAAVPPVVAPPPVTVEPPPVGAPVAGSVVAPGTVSSVTAPASGAAGSVDSNVVAPPVDCRSVCSTLPGMA